MRTRSVMLLAWVACTPARPPAPTPPVGRWVDGDLHVHATGGSNDADDRSYPHDIAAVARQRGLGFVILTDHSNATGSMGFGDDVENHPNLGPEFPYRAEAARLTEPGEFVMLVGNEISPIAALGAPGPPRGHVGCLPRPGDPFAAVPDSFAFIDRPPGAITGGAGVTACKALGGFAVINHPYSFATWVAYDWTSLEYDALEVWNGGLQFDAWDLKGVQAWWCDRALGRTVAPVGASDCHRVSLEPPGTLTDPSLGVARTRVFVSELTADGVAAGLAAGRTIVHDELASLDVWASAGAETFLPGDRASLPAGTRLTFHVRATADRAAQLQVMSVGDGACTDRRGQGSQGEVTVSPRREAAQALEAGVTEATLEVEVQPGRDYAVRLWHGLDSDRDQSGLALSNALRVE